MPAPAGNSYNGYSLQELKTLAINYIDHIRQGYSKHSFEDCDYRTIENAIENREELLTEKRELDKAWRGNRKYWEKVGKEGTTGVIRNFNATSWIFNMKNRFPDEWADKTQNEVSGGLEINKKAEDLTDEELASLISNKLRGSR